MALLFLINCYALSASCQTYITNVTIIDVINQKLVPAQTVVINNGIISNIQPSKKIKILSGATVIDGKGKFLMPGLTDAHVHFFQSGGLYTRPDAIDLRKNHPYQNEIDWVHNNMQDFLRRYIKAGITSVIDVGSNYHFLQQRDSFENKSYAPEIFMTGPLLTSYEPPVFRDLKNEEPFLLVKTPEDGIKGVQAELPYHPDFIKIWYIVSQNKDMIEASAKKFEPVVKAIIDEAHKHHLKVAVHATQRITAQLAVESGCDYLVHGIDDEIVPDDFIKLLKSKNVIDCPTLIVEDGYFKTFGQNMNYSAYDIATSNPQQLSSIQDLKHMPDTSLAGVYKKSFNLPVMTNRLAHEDSVRMVNLKKMIDGGITIVAGTDAGNIGTQHASSLFDELKAMKQSGLSNWQIIQSATINPTKILDKQHSLGSIAIGKKADLVLLNANPVEDLDNITHINLVINKGKVIDPDEIIK
ncbi:MAG: amidohydrolase family protein [Bacteroidota bacterium]|nr:amidohydrolase family protein [Bacteroidota bacterium]